MRLGTLLTIVAVIAFVFGLGFLLLPEQTLALFGVTLDAAGILFVRLLGGALIGFGVLDWLARNVSDSEAQRAIVVAGFTWHTIGFVVALFAQVAGVLNPLGWLNVGTFLLIALGFGYFLMPIITRSAASPIVSD